jgi:hypothetical protein
MDSLEQIRRWLKAMIVAHIAADHGRMLTGHVTAVDTTAKRCTVQLGAEGPTTICAYAIDLPVAVNDDVYVSWIGTSYLVIGRAKLVAP